MKGNNRLLLADHEAYKEMPYWSIMDGKYKEDLANILRTSLFTSLQTYRRYIITIALKSGRR
jgi:hypothetical protein